MQIYLILKPRCVIILADGSDKMKGIAYGVGVGPGDPELITLKAVRLIKENNVIAVAGKTAESSAAYRIALKSVPEIADKELVPLYMPMVKDREIMHKAHTDAAKIIENYLENGRNVVYITLGDPTVYCTFSYLQHILENDGHKVELVSGVTSFCAAAARLNMPLAEWNEQIHILPAVHKTKGLCDYPDTCVLMKSASSMSEVKKLIKESGRNAAAVENCGMENEKIYLDTADIPDDAGYFSLVITKEEPKSF